METRSSRVRSTMSDTFWILILAIVVLFAFFVALGAVSPGEVVWLTLARARARPAVGRPRRLGLAPPQRPRPRGDPQPRAAGLLSSAQLDPEIAEILEGMLALSGPPAHEVPVDQARAGHEAETEQMSGPGEPVAEVRDLEIESAAGTIPARLYRPEGGRPAPARRLPARRRLDARLDRLLRHRRARARQRGGRDRRQRRVPARARGAVPGRARGRDLRGPLARRQRGRARRRPRSGWRSPATAPAATSPRSSRGGCAARSRCACRR